LGSSGEQVGVVADGGALAGECGNEVVAVVAAEDEVEAAAQSGAQVGLGGAAGAVAAVESGQRSQFGRIGRRSEACQGVELVGGLCGGRGHVGCNDSHRPENPDPALVTRMARGGVSRMIRCSA
jgi:hypothetical protein